MPSHRPGSPARTLRGPSAACADTLFRGMCSTTTASSGYPKKTPTSATRCHATRWERYPHRQSASQPKGEPMEQEPCFESLKQLIGEAMLFGTRIADNGYRGLLPDEGNASIRQGIERLHDST